VRRYRLQIVPQNDVQPFQGSQGLRQHFLGNAFDGPNKFAIPAWAFPQRIDDEQRPLIGEKGHINA
jgi:hypothetical protein